MLINQKPRTLTVTSAETPYGVQLLVRVNKRQVADVRMSGAPGSHELWQKCQQWANEIAAKHKCAPILLKWDENGRRIIEG